MDKIIELIPYILIALMFVAILVLFIRSSTRTSKLYMELIEKNKDLELKIKSTSELTESVISNDYVILTFSDAQDIINDRINRLWEEKYLIFYTLKEYKMIPNMDNEIEQFTQEIMDSFSPRIMGNILQYYSKSYLVRMITRKAQLLMISYIDTHKPTTK